MQNSNIRASLFYHYLGKGRDGFGHVTNALAWMHLVLIKAGITATAAMMMLAGHQG